MPTLNGISYQIKLKRAGGDSFTYSKDSLDGTRFFLINWSDREAFVLALVGQSERVGDDVRRTIGQDFGGIQFPLRCNSARVDGLGKPTLAPGETHLDYPLAIVTAQYASIKPDEEPVDENIETGDLNRPITTDIDFTTEVLSAKGGIFTANGKIIETNYAVLVPKTNIGVTFRNVPFSAFTQGTPNDGVSVMAKINDKGGQVNSDLPTWIAGRIFVDEETLMFNGASASRETPVFKGDLLESPWTVNYSFTHKRQGWNTAYDPTFLSPTPPLRKHWPAVTPAPFLSTTFKDIQIKYT